MAVKMPTGCTITRSGNTFTMKWTCGESYSHQVLRFRHSAMPKDQWIQPSIGAGTTSYSYTITPASTFCPAKTNVRASNDTNSIARFVFRIRGFKNGWSEKSDVNYYTWRASRPQVPTLEAELDNDHSNVTKFTWNTTLSDANTDNYYFWHVEAETILVPSDMQTYGPSHNWSSSQRGYGRTTGPANYSWTLTEDTEQFTIGPYTRWVRVRARGAGYDSDWRYAKHVYATPHQPTIVSCETKETLSYGLRLLPVWAAPQDASRPIDKTIIQYALTKPGPDLSCSPGTQWTDADASADTWGNDGATFVVDDRPGKDECLFIRVVAHHDKRYTASAPFLVKVGFLPPPKELSVVYNDQTYRATINATNSSEIEDSIMVVEYQENDSAPIPVGIIQHGFSSIDIQCPSWESTSKIAFRVYAMVGSYELVSDGVPKTYNITAKLKSEVVTSGGEVPLAPTNVAVSPTTVDGTARMTWDWAWEEANITELSWSEHADAWESTNEPSTYTVTNLHAPAWNIAGLSNGVTYYFRARLGKISDDEKTTYGPYSDPVSLSLSSSPRTPILQLSDSIITEDGSVTAYWAYATTDGTSQAFAKICEATINGEYPDEGEGESESNITYGNVIAQTTSAQSITINAKDAGWTAGNTYNLCIKVYSASGEESEGWSEPVSVRVVEPITAEITSTSLVDDSLTEMPLTLTVTGAKTDGITTVIIERAANYHMSRPDDSVFDGYENETVAIMSHEGESQFTITNDDLIGVLDDEAKYRIVATVQDSIGQSSEVSKEFEVHWEHQAVMPTANVSIENNVALIEPIKPAGFAAGDYCDIYRLSADKPELIYAKAEFDTRYVDPYPTLGKYGGHRIVYITANGDYITEDKLLAWADYGADDSDVLDIFGLVIDFNGEQVVLPYNLSLSNSWDKDFQETKYLGGSIQGDWNPTISMSSSFSTAVAVALDSELIAQLRRLANFAGACRVRTPDGSNFSANVTVQESREERWINKLSTFSIDVTRIDMEGLDGMTYDEYRGNE